MCTGFLKNVHGHGVAVCMYLAILFSRIVLNTRKLSHINDLLQNCFLAYILNIWFFEKSNKLDLSENLKVPIVYLLSINPNVQYSFIFQLASFPQVHLRTGYRKICQHITYMANIARDCCHTSQWSLTNSFFLSSSSFGQYTKSRVLKILTFNKKTNKKEKNWITKVCNTINSFYFLVCLCVCF